MKATNYYIVYLLLLFCIGCNSPEIDKFPEESAPIRLFVRSTGFTRTVDEDNPASEQLIKNISIFLTEPSSANITHKYVYAGFSFSGDNGVVTISSAPSELLSKDIYIIANYDNENELNQIESLDNLRDLTTPEVNKTNNLDPANGFCMFGSFSGFNFNNQEGNSVTVTLERTCAKFRVNLTFPNNPALSINNSFLMQRAAKYTYVIENPTAVLPQSEYFNFAAPDILADNGNQVYTNTTYVYEANLPAILTVYTHINNSIEQQEFTATLPIPQRNYLYDLQVKVYEDTETTRNSFSGENVKYKYSVSLNIYNEEGELIIQP